jgi:hypothetical protein
MRNFWLYDKHKKEVEYTELDSKVLRFKIDSGTNFKFDTSDNNPYNALFDWDRIKPSYSFFFDFDNNEDIIRRQLSESKLKNSSFIYIETLSDIPILRTRTEYFIANWIDFIDANAGQGSICITDDFKLLMEFTDDRKYYLFSNFLISQNNISIE